MGSETSYPPNYDQANREGVQYASIDRRVLGSVTDRNNYCFVNEPLVISNRTDLELA